MAMPVLVNCASNTAAFQYEGRRKILGHWVWQVEALRETIHLEQKFMQGKLSIK